MSKKTLPARTGNVKDVDCQNTTMWAVKEYQCLNNAEHQITGSTRRLYCINCGIYWNRAYVK